MADIFERLSKGRPRPIKNAQETSPAQKLLNFLQRWPKDTISMRELQQFGPRVIQMQRSRIDSAEVLVRHGWLAPIQSHRRDRRVWQVVRRPLVHPTVEL